MGDSEVSFLTTIADGKVWEGGSMWGLNGAWEVLGFGPLFGSRVIVPERSSCFILVAGSALSRAVSFSQALTSIGLTSDEG